MTSLKLSRSDPAALTEAVFALARIASLLLALPALAPDAAEVNCTRC